MSLFVRRICRAVLPAFVVAAVGGLSASDALAQQRRETAPTSIMGTPGTPDRAVGGKRGFALFGSGDFAVTGMRGVGQLGWGLTNYGPCAADGGAGPEDCGHVLAAGAWRSHYFEITHVVGAPRHEFRKIRTINPAAGPANLGGGYTYQWNNPLLAMRGEVGPADNSIGVLYSGAVSTADNSCRDFRSASNGYIAAGLTLLPGSDCPLTWGPNGFQGARPISDSAFIRLAAAQGNNFKFDYFSIPENEKDQTKFLGNFSTYGLMSDYHDEILDLYGANVTGKTKAPSITGYPLGLEMRFEAFTSSLPTIANAVIYQMTVVNNSARVYGQGIDYDSLYMGLEMGPYSPAQRANTYFLSERNAAVHTGGQVHPGCNGARVIPGTPACPTREAFTRGAVGVVVLKSPIGDTRNKLLSRDGPFKNLSSPHVDDTITFNHGRKCGYGSCLLGNMLDSDRRLFGVLSSTGDNALDGRSVNDLAAASYYYAFRPVDFPNRSGKFNHHTVPGWDYNGGGEDTLFYDTCHQSINNPLGAARGSSSKCVSTWSDSMPGGFVNSYGNVGGIAAAGPFALAAGDTTSFVYAFIGAPDSASFEALINKVTEAYLTFWVGPTAPPQPVVVASTIGTQSNGRPFVEIIYSDAPEVFVDPFLMKYAADLEASVDPGQVALRTNNPTLIADIRARAKANFAELLIYKSCDGGATFTSNDGNCGPDVAIDAAGNAIGNGYQPYAVIKFDPAKGIPNVFRDNSVVAGQTYLYSFVTRSVGFSAIVRNSPTDIGTTLVVAEALTSPVPTSGPNTLTIRVPASRPNNGVTSTFTLTRDGTPSTLPVNVNLSTAAQPGTYKLTFGNRFIVRTATNRTTQQAVTVVRVQDFVAEANTRRNGAPITGGLVLKEEVFTGSGTIATSGVTAGTTTTSLSGDSTVAQTTYTGLAFLLSRDGSPLYISASPSLSETVPGTFFGNPNFPGFTISIDTSRVGKFVAGSERAIKANGDTINAGVLNAFAVQFDEGSAASTPRNGSAGKYQFRFADDAYGPGAPFRLALPNVAQTQTAVTNSLRSRVVADTGITSAEAKAAIVAAVGAGTTLGGQINAGILIPAKFPFTVRNATFGRDARLAMVRRTDIGRTNTILLGTENDTLRVAVPDSIWVPGDQFYILETIEVDSMVGGALVFSPTDSTKPIRNSRLVATFAPTTLGCAAPRSSCNPLAPRTVGANGYLTYAAGTTLELTYEAGFTRESELTLAITPVTLTNNFGKQEQSAIRVVPNPYVVQSQYDAVNGRLGDPRVLFTNVPATGTLRIYSVSGQFLQAVAWTEADLQGSRDLPYNLRTREGLDLASGLYIYVITAADARGKAQLARGKFVVIR